MTLGVIAYLVWLVAMAVALPAPAVGAVRGGWRGFVPACMAPVGGVLAICFVWAAVEALESAHWSIPHSVGTSVSFFIAGTVGLVLVAAGWKAAMVRREPEPPDLRWCSRCGYDLRGINRHPRAEFMVCPECGTLVPAPPEFEEH